MRTFFYISVLVLIGIAIALYLKPELRDELNVLQKRELLPADATTLYKWQDNNGQWQLSDSPPSDGTPFTSVVVEHNTNVIPSISTTSKKGAEDKKNPTWQDSLYSK